MVAGYKAHDTRTDVSGKIKKGKQQLLQTAGSNEHRNIG